MYVCVLYPLKHLWNLTITSKVKLKDIFIGIYIMSEDVVKKKTLKFKQTTLQYRWPHFPSSRKSDYYKNRRFFFIVLLGNILYFKNILSLYCKEIRMIFFSSFISFIEWQQGDNLIVNLVTKLSNKVIIISEIYYLTQYLKFFVCPSASL